MYKLLILIILASSCGKKINLKSNLQEDSGNGASFEERTLGFQEAPQVGNHQVVYFRDGASGTVELKSWSSTGLTSELVATIPSAYRGNSKDILYADGKYYLRTAFDVMVISGGTGAWTTSVNSPLPPNTSFRGLFNIGARIFALVNNYTNGQGGLLELSSDGSAVLATHTFTGYTNGTPNYCVSNDNILITYKGLFNLDLISNTMNEVATPSATNNYKDIICASDKLVIVNDITDGGVVKGQLEIMDVPTGVISVGYTGSNDSSMISATRRHQKIFLNYRENGVSGDRYLVHDLVLNTTMSVPTISANFLGAFHTLATSGNKVLMTTFHTSNSNVQMIAYDFVTDTYALTSSFGYAPPSNSYISQAINGDNSSYFITQQGSNKEVSVIDSSSNISPLITFPSDYASIGVGDNLFYFVDANEVKKVDSSGTITSIETGVANSTGTNSKILPQ
jgi:hypothetical protein